jgi:hypothetical protein
MDPQTPALRRACGALWLATLSLMTAFMQTQAPAHRLLLARRIAANLGTLQGQECFTEPSRASFSRLSRHWGDKAARLAAQEQRPQGKLGIVVRSIHG